MSAGSAARVGALSGWLCCITPVFDDRLWCRFFEGGVGGRRRQIERD